MTAMEALSFRSKAHRKEFISVIDGVEDILTCVQEDRRLGPTEKVRNINNNLPGLLTTHLIRYFHHASRSFHHIFAVSSTVSEHVSVK